jgi:hypothetical protein
MPAFEAAASSCQQRRGNLPAIYLVYDWKSKIELLQTMILRIEQKTAQLVFDEFKIAAPLSQCFFGNETYADLR